MKKILFISILLIIISCAENFKVPVRFYNQTNDQVINVYIGTNHYSRIDPNDKTGYEYMTPQTYKVLGQFNGADNTDDFRGRVTFTAFNSYSVTIDKKGNIGLVVEN
ncbi:MAG: hypothetical protein JXB50_15705 [Spirochaetes bacterium]|nr:hypothetical protein [Spirochaetota bacterium]